MTYEEKKNIVIKNYFGTDCDMTTNLMTAYSRGFNRGAEKAEQVVAARDKTIAELLEKIEKLEAEVPHWHKTSDCEPDLDEVSECDDDISFYSKTVVGYDKSGYRLLHLYSDSWTDAHWVNEWFDDVPAPSYWLPLSKPEDEV